MIAELREVCIKEKHIDPDKDDRVNYVIKELEDQIQVLFILQQKAQLKKVEVSANLCILTSHFLFVAVGLASKGVRF